MVLIGKKSPHFSAKAVVNGQIQEEFSLENFHGKYVFFFFYPLDFTFVCPTELHAFQERLAEFKSRNTEVVACSIDSCYSHIAWTNTPKSQGGIQGVSYPLVSDIHKDIARKYQVLHEEEGIAYRGQFLIDKQGIVRHQLINDLPIGRSVDEALRLLDALIFHEQHGEVCPANWKVGARSMEASASGLTSYFGR
jgi:peroxiredoxin (alkyl hydroperoxide reductase subunit C)